MCYNKRFGRNLKRKNEMSSAGAELLDQDSVGITALERKQNGCIHMSFTFVSCFFFFFGAGTRKAACGKKLRRKSCRRGSLYRDLIGQVSMNDRSKKVSSPHYTKTKTYSCMSLLQVLGTCHFILKAMFQWPLYLIKCWLCFGKIMKTKVSVSICRH